LEKLNESKDQFIMITQHHLRTPVTNITWRLESLLAGAFGPQSQQSKQALKDALSSTDGLKRIIEDFLSITALKAGASILSLARKSLLPAVEKNLAELKSDTERMHISVKYPTEKKDWPELTIDESKIREVLFIIIENAVRYNVDHGSINISTATDDGYFTVTVENTGIGIGIEDKKSIASALFYRGKYARAVYPTGMGVGLTVSKAILKAHKGDLTIESDGEGRGARVKMRVPI
jgi:signal transduction histidine kinase